MKLKMFNVVIALLVIYCTVLFAVLHEYKPFQRRYTNGSLSGDFKITFKDHNEVTENSLMKNPLGKDPCEKFIPPKTRFLMNGARISDLKCAEYNMLDLVNRETVREREEKCREKQGKKRIEKSTKIIICNYSTKPGEYPHMVAIGWKSNETNTWTFLCGGSLISPNFVLTAAHCSSRKSVNLQRLEPNVVRVGVRDMQITEFEIPLDIKIKRFIQHPNRSPPKRYYDIALVELDTALEFSKLVQPACLEGKYFTSRHNVAVTGWGVTYENSIKLSSIIQSGYVDIIESKYCDSLLMLYRDRNWWGLMDHQMCAGNIGGGVDTCQGDSGGPLQVKLKDTKYEGSMHMIIGVTSFGIRCGRKYQPGIYTKVSSFLDWIESVVWPK